MDCGLALVQFLHILGGAAWLGAFVFASLVLLPFVFGQPIERQRDLVRTVILGPERLLIGAALLAVVLGVVRGTVFGPIRSIDALSSRYGIVWLAAIAVTVAIFAVGGLITSPAARRLAGDWPATMPCGQSRQRHGSPLGAPTRFVGCAWGSHSNCQELSSSLP